MAYGSLYDYYSANGGWNSWDSSTRQADAKKAGISGYTGTADQNAQLLKYLTSSGPTAPKPSPSPATSVFNNATPSTPTGVTYGSLIPKPSFIGPVSPTTTPTDPKTAYVQNQAQQTPYTPGYGITGIPGSTVNPGSTPAPAPGIPGLSGGQSFSDWNGSSTLKYTPPTQSTPNQSTLPYTPYTPAVQPSSGISTQQQTPTPPKTAWDTLVQSGMYGTPTTTPPNPNDVTTTGTGKIGTPPAPAPNPAGGAPSGNQVSTPTPVKTGGSPLPYDTAALIKQTQDMLNFGQPGTPFFGSSADQGYPGANPMGNTTATGGGGTPTGGAGTPAGGTPPGGTPPATGKTTEQQAYEDYLASLQMSPEQKAAQEYLNRLITASMQANEAALNSGETLGFAGGEAQRVGRNNQFMIDAAARNLEAQTGIQNSRQSMAKARMDYEQNQANRAQREREIERQYDPNKPFELSPGEERWEWNPATKRYEKVAGVPPTPKASDSNSLDAGERRDDAYSQINSALTPGAKTSAGVPYLDAEGLLTKKGFDSMVQFALASGISRMDFIKNYASYMTPSNPDALDQVMTNYGLTAAEKKILQGY